MNIGSDDTVSPDSAPIATRLLDAAATVVGRYGLRRTTMDDIARAARCSRQTLYKHYPSREDLFANVFVREVERYLEGLNELLDGSEPLEAEHLVDAWVFTMRYIRTHPIVQGILAADEHGLVSVLALGDGAVLTASFTGVTKALARFVAAGLVPPTDPALLGEAFVRSVTSFLVLPQFGLDPEDEDALRAYGRRLLLQAGPTA